MSVMTIPWGAVHTFRAPILKAGSLDYAHTADWTPAAGDVMVSKDGGAFANIATLPTYIAASGTLTWKLSAAECEATEIIIQVIDKAATKKVTDQMFRLVTAKVGAFDVGRAAAGAASSITLGSSASAVADFYKGAVVAITGGTGVNQSRLITGYTTGKIATVDHAWAVMPDATSVYGVWPNAAASAASAAPAPADLSTAAVSAVVAAVLDGVDGIEPGLTAREALRLMAAMLFGQVSGAGTGTEVFKAAKTAAKARVTVTATAAGNRTAVVVDPA
jgi:hypothetical protein